MQAAGSAPATDLVTAPCSGRSLLSRLKSLFLPCRPEAPERTAASGPSSYLPGLDGLRALSVITVLVYHARPQWLPGGFLGVEVFFVISGFIITRALLAEWQEQGRIGLASFWLRRARRLLPAVGLLLAGILAYVAIFEPGEVARLRGDVLAALVYVTNWHLILGDQSYFDSFQRPSMLRHLWSLAIEEQFYIVWPLVLAFGLPILKRRGFVVLIIAGIAASTTGMALLYDPAGDNSRAYFGTDTRAAGLLVGALLALVLGAWQVSAASPRRRHGLALLGVATLSLLAGASFWLDERNSFLYQGGFLTVSLLSALVILAVTQRNAFSRILGARPLRWVGVRSYGIYLWHWPVYMLVWPQEAAPSQLALQILAVVVIAAASYALVEKPVREGALGRAWRRVQAWPAQSWRYRGAVVFSGAGAVSVVFSLFAVAVMAKPPEVPSYFRAGSIRIQSIVVAEDAGSIVRGPTLMGRVQTTITALTTDERRCPSDNLSPGGALLGVASTPFGSTCPQPLTLFERPFLAEDAPTEIGALAPAPSGEETAALFGEIDWEPSAQPEANALQGGGTEEPELVTEAPAAASAAPPAHDVQATQPPVAPATVLQSPPTVTAIGDSVMLGAAYTLASSIPGIDLDAAVGRQAATAVALLQEKTTAGLLGQVVVMHIGNNGTLTSEQFDQVMAVIGPDRTAVFLSLKVPRAWEGSNNAVIVNGVSRYGNAVLIDWATAAASYPGMLHTDGIHLTPSGSSYYSQLVVAAVSGG